MCAKNCDILSEKVTDSMIAQIINLHLQHSAQQLCFTLRPPALPSSEQ